MCWRRGNETWVSLGTEIVGRGPPSLAFGLLSRFSFHLLLSAANTAGLETRARARISPRRPRPPAGREGGSPRSAAAGGGREARLPPCLLPSSQGGRKPEALALEAGGCDWWEGVATAEKPERESRSSRSYLGQEGYSATERLIASERDETNSICAAAAAVAAREITAPPKRRGRRRRLRRRLRDLAAAAAAAPLPPPPPPPPSELSQAQVRCGFAPAPAAGLVPPPGTRAPRRSWLRPARARPSLLRGRPRSSRGRKGSRGPWMRSRRRPPARLQSFPAPAGRLQPTAANSRASEHARRRWQTARAGPGRAPWPD